MGTNYTWVYLMYDPFTNLYKIGRSDDPEQRLNQLRNPANFGTIPAAPTEYVLIEAWLVPDTMEALFHRRFADYRVRGEWFDMSSFIESLGASSISVADATPEIISSFLSRTLKTCQRFYAERSWIEQHYERLVADLTWYRNKVRELTGDIEVVKSPEVLALEDGVVEVDHADIPF